MYRPKRYCKGSAESWRNISHDIFCSATATCMCPVKVGVRWTAWSCVRADRAPGLSVGAFFLLRPSDLDGNFWPDPWTILHRTHWRTVKGCVDGHRTHPCVSFAERFRRVNRVSYLQLYSVLFYAIYTRTSYTWGAKCIERCHIRASCNSLEASKQVCL